jgi:trigger factor
VEGAEVEVPDALVERELERRLDDIEHELGHRGLKLDAYLAYQQLTRDQWLERERPEAEARLRVDLVLDAVAKQEGVEPSDEDVLAYQSQEIQRDPELAPRATELLLSRSARDYFRSRLTRLRTLERLKTLAGGGEPAAPAPAESPQEA